MTFSTTITDSFRFSFVKDWDPGRDIRSAIERDRAMIASGKIDWPSTYCRWRMDRDED